MLAAACAGGGDDASPTTSTSTISGPAAGEPCDAFGSVDVAATVDDERLSEISGVVAGPGGDGTLWAHNDSGDDAVVYRLGPDGAVAQTVAVSGASARDWEDMASHPDGRLFVADIGDNLRHHTDATIYAFPDPGPSATATDPVTAITFTYPDGPHDAEVLLVDPVSGDVFVLTKEIGGSVVYQIPPDGGVAEEAGTVDLGLTGIATGGDVSPDGAQIAVRTYGSVRIFERRAGESVPDALGRRGCRAPSGLEDQGEAIGFVAGGGYVTIGEGDRPPIHVVSTDRAAIDGRPGGPEGGRRLRKAPAPW